MKNYVMYGQSDVGRKRQDNQDSFLTEALDEYARLAIVCDGMGGVSGGKLASSIAVETIADVIREDYRPDMTTGGIRTLLMHAVSSGNHAVYLRSKKDEAVSGMGTTCEVVLLTGEHAYIAHVGDSRVYLLREGELYQATHDHSLVQMMVDRGEITKEEAATHPKRNIITRVLGVSSIVDVDFIEVERLEGTAFLLCSDGLSTPLTDAEIARIWQETSAEALCDTLIQEANEAGGPDNITAVVLTEQKEEAI